MARVSVGVVHIGNGPGISYQLKLCSGNRKAHFMPTRAACNMMLFRGFGKSLQDSAANLGKTTCFKRD